MVRFTDFVSGALACIGLFFAYGAAPVFAEGSCDFDAAKEDYQAARFDEALAKLDCKKPTWEVYRLRAWIDIARNDSGEAQKAVEDLLRAQPGYEPESSDPLQLARLIEKVRGEEGSGLVTVASRMPQELREAPAPVVVVTAAQIERRGYLDLEDVFHDLPGFDISRTNGEIYSNLDPRGFRATANDRMLLRVDGITQNDLSSGTAHLSRQYSLQDVDRVEVLYGPASALYGANAFGGVINVVTRPPEAILDPGENFGWRLAATSGSLDTRAADFTLAGRLKMSSLAWSLTGHVDRSSELDLSRFEDWDYHYDVDYQKVLRLTGPAARSFPGAASPSLLYTVVRDANGVVVAVEPTAEAAKLARDLDRQTLAQSTLSFSDPTYDWSLSAKLSYANVVFGLQTWSRQEGSLSAYTELSRAGVRRGNLWTPTHTAFFIDFTAPLGDFQLQLDTHYRQSGLDSGVSSTREFQTYFSGGLGLANLVGCDRGKEGSCLDGRILPRQFSQLSTQIGGEARLVYDHPEKGWRAVGGVELELGSIQSQPSSSLLLQSPATQHSDLGVYAQAIYSPPRWSRLKLVGAGRLDVDQVDSLTVKGAGYGSVFSPRLAALFDLVSGSKNGLRLKANYSHGFQEPTDFERFGTAPGGPTVAAGKLAPEKIDSTDLGLGWRHSGGDWLDGVTVDLAAFQSDATGLIRLQATDQCLEKGGPCDLFVSQLRNTGEVKAQGGYLAFGAENKHWHDTLALRAFGNYTYTDSHERDPVDAFGAPLVDPQGRRIAEQRLPDFARHRANLGLNADLGYGWNIDLRLNYAGVRRSPGGDAAAPAYVLAGAAVGYQNLLPDLLPGLKLQLVVHNLFDKKYQDPGVQLPGRGFAELIPQPGRTLYLRVLYQRRKQLERLP